MRSAARMLAAVLLSVSATTSSSQATANSPSASSLGADQAQPQLNYDTSLFQPAGLASRSDVDSTPDQAATPQSTRPGKQPYRVGSGDKVRITTFGEDRFSGEFLVNGDGQISFPLFGAIQARGLTIPELTASISRRLSPDYVRNPHVTGEVTTFRSVYILGEVGKPGEYPYVEGLTIYALIAKAGGFSYRASRSKIYVRHEDDATEGHISLDTATPVRPGDTIRIPQRFF